jgi:hypothetical protein
LKLFETMNRLVGIHLVRRAPVMASLRSHAGFRGSPLLTRAIVVAFFLGYLVEQSPHLVHHLFEPDEARSECAYLAAGDRHQITPLDGPVLVWEPAVVGVVGPAIVARPVTHDTGTPGARAPPAAS